MHRSRAKVKLKIRAFREWRWRAVVVGLEEKVSAKDTELRQLKKEGARAAESGGDSNGNKGGGERSGSSECQEVAEHLHEIQEALQAIGIRIE